MSLFSTLPPPRKIVYPCDDGNPMAEITLQYEWIVTIKGGFEDLFRDDPKVFVAGDLLWYPVEGNNVIRQAPDTMVIFGRPKGDRTSYRQWEEGGVAPQVVWEVLSLGNRAGEMQRKFAFYEQYGVEEYYVYDPERGAFSVWNRQDDKLIEVPDPLGWKSPLLGVRFEINGVDLEIIRPDGLRFQTFGETCRQRDQARELAEREFCRAEAEKQRAELSRQQLESERQRADSERQRAEKLIAQLRAAGIEPQL